jgi:hypothetical protein
MRRIAVVLARARRNRIRIRLASAIHESSEEGTNSQTGACGLPKAHIWCEGEIENGKLNEAWKIVASCD